MNLHEFTQTLAQPAPPDDLSPSLSALWHDAKGDWQTAHAIAQEREGTKEYDQLHAYLHRKEGDESNARYWYRRAGIEVFQGTLQKEWDQLVTEALNP